MITDATKDFLSQSLSIQNPEYFLRCLDRWASQRVINAVGCGSSTLALRPALQTAYFGPLLALSNGPEYFQIVARRFRRHARALHIEQLLAIPSLLLLEHTLGGPA